MWSLKFLNGMDRQDFIQLSNGPLGLDFVLAPDRIERFADARCPHVEVEGVDSLSCGALPWGSDWGTGKEVLGLDKCNMVRAHTTGVSADEWEVQGELMAWRRKGAVRVLTQLTLTEIDAAEKARAAGTPAGFGIPRT